MDPPPKKTRPFTVADARRLRRLALVARAKAWAQKLLTRGRKEKRT